MVMHSRCPAAWFDSPEKTRSPDGEVLEALRRGDRRAALAALMRDYGGAVRRFCADLLADSALGEDVAQTTFVNAFESLASFAGEAGCKAWLLGIARHRCLDVLKSRRRWFRLVEGKVAGDAKAPVIAHPPFLSNGSAQSESPVRVRRAPARRKRAARQ